MIVINLPPPPSVNGMYLNIPGRGRIKSKTYKAWRHEAGWMLQTKHPGRINGAVDIDILVSDKVRGDLDNRVKGCLDILVAHQVIEDDQKKYVKHVSAKWSKDVEGVRVTITEAQNA